MPDVSTGSDVQRAEHAAELAQADPASALRLAEEILDVAGLEPDTRATALWAMGLASRELDALDDAHHRFAEAVAVADEAGLVGRAARIRLSWSLVLVYRGDTDAALDVMEQARPHLVGAEAGHCDVQHALVMTRLGRLDEALDDARRALPLLRAAGDTLAEARLLSNLGVLHVYRGELAEASTALGRARHLAEELDQTLLLARTILNQAFVHGRRGDVPRSLALFDEAESTFRQLDDPDPHLAVLDADRAEVLLGAGLADEAHARAEASLAALTKAENVTDRSEVLLLVARCRFASGDFNGSAEAAAAAASLFSSQARPSWGALASFVAVQAAALEAPGLGDRAEAVADELAQAGWRREEQQARLLAARSLLAAGDAERASPLLEAVASGARSRTTAAERTVAWHATALLRLTRADRAGARRAVAAGLRVVENHRATLGASELRAHASAAGADLALIGVRLAVEDRRPREAWRWIESLRAVSVLVPPARPPDDAELAEDLARLRAAEAERWTATTPAAADALSSRVRALETAIVRRTRRVAGDTRTDRFDPAGQADALGDRVLLEYALLDGELLGLAVRQGRVSMQHLGPVEPVDREAASVLFFLHRLAREGLSAGSLAAAGAGLGQALDTLDHLLVAPFRRSLGDDALVVVPAGRIRRVPFGALPSLAGRPVSVAPSAAAWLRASTVPPPDGQVLLVAGPELEGAGGEIDELSAVHADAEVLRPPTSTVDAVLTRLGRGVGIAHLAAHGTFRADNPLFSSLLLSDGPLTVHDLARAQRCPAWFVLSACDAAVTSAAGGDDMLGFGAGLLALGAANLVAPITPVSDRASRPLMVALHRRFLAGDRPAEALAALTRSVPDDPAVRGVHAAFSVLGR